MLNKFRITILFCVIVSAPIQAKNVNPQFQGIIKQENDYSCGTATLATLLNGLYGLKIDETKIVDIISKDVDEPEKIKKKGYSLLNLQNASNSIGYQAQWRKIAPKYLSMIKQPVVLLIGLKSKFPHFVVLKGIKDDIAYLADPIRGNIRIDYKKLVSESISEKFPYWYVMATQTPQSNSWRQNSSLALSSSKKKRDLKHLTDIQANLRSMISLSKKEQSSFSFDYHKDNRKIKIANNIHLNEKTDRYSFGYNYGIDDNTEIDASLTLSKTIYTNNINDTIEKTDWLDAYTLSLSHRYQLDNTNQKGILARVSLSYIQDQDIFNSTVSLSMYRSIDTASIIGGFNISKSFTSDSELKENLSTYNGTIFTGLVKPLGNKYSTSITTSYKFEKDSLGKFTNSYAIDGSLSWIYNKHIQLQPSIKVEFDKTDIDSDISVGLKMIYLGSW